MFLESPLWRFFFALYFCNIFLCLYASCFCTFRLVLKKQVHKKTVIRDGKEETIVTEDTHVEQDNEGPEELQESVQNIIDQFMEGQDPAADKQ